MLNKFKRSLMSAIHSLSSKSCDNLSKIPDAVLIRYVCPFLSKASIANLFATNQDNNQRLFSLHFEPAKERIIKRIKYIVEVDRKNFGDNSINDSIDWKSIYKTNCNNKNRNIINQLNHLVYQVSKKTIEGLNKHCLHDEWVRSNLNFSPTLKAPLPECQEDIMIISSLFRGFISSHPFSYGIGTIKSLITRYPHRCFSILKMCPDAWEHRSHELKGNISPLFNFLIKKNYWRQAAHLINLIGQKCDYHNPFFTTLIVQCLDEGLFSAAFEVLEIAQGRDRFSGIFYIVQDALTRGDSDQILKLLKLFNSSLITNDSEEALFFEKEFLSAVGFISQLYHRLSPEASDAFLKLIPAISPEWLKMAIIKTTLRSSLSKGFLLFCSSFIKNDICDLESILKIISSFNNKSHLFALLIEFYTDQNNFGPAFKIAMAISDDHARNEKLSAIQAKLDASRPIENPPLVPNAVIPLQKKGWFRRFFNF